MQPIHSSSNPLALQAAPEALRLRPKDHTPNNTEMRFTVKIEDTPKATQIFDELARSKDIGIKRESDAFDFDDHGGGLDMHNTLHFGFRPNRPDGTFSPALQMRISDFRREFQEKLDEAGIRNYAPAE